jgi:cell division protein ZapE
MRCSRAASRWSPPPTPRRPTCTRNGLQRARFLPAIALIEKHCHVVEMASSHDWRLRALAQAPVYLTPPGAEAHRALERIFASQASGTIEQDGAHRYQRPQHPVSQARRQHSVVRFRSAVRRPARRRRLHRAGQGRPGVIISNVPQFTIYSEDAAKRFVQLVDEFYDRHVKLVLSAAAPITELYDGERLRAEFGRTESRLIEMQSKDYLALEHRAD